MKITGLEFVNLYVSTNERGYSMMKISVVIPVYNEDKRIRKTLDAIYGNSEQPYEVIVVDGCSTDKTKTIIKRYYPQAIIVTNQRKNAAAGRNIGIKKAKGSVIAFTDGDCIVDKDWLKQIRIAFENNDIDGVGGKVLNATPENHYEEYWGNLAWNIIMNFPDEGYEVTKQTLNDAFVTANCAYSRKLLYEIKGFNNYFANNAEDVDLCWRALKYGAKLRYAPSIIIYAHNVTSIYGIAKKSFRNGVSSSKLQKVYGKKINYDPNIYKMLGKNIIGFIRNEKDANLNCVELISHLAGKYYGSLKNRIINI